MAMTVKEAYAILSKNHGYTGPRTKKGISEFINARDINITLANQGVFVKEYDEGGLEKGDVKVETKRRGSGSGTKTRTFRIVLSKDAKAKAESLGVLDEVLELASGRAKKGASTFSGSNKRVRANAAADEIRSLLAGQVEEAGSEEAEVTDSEEEVVTDSEEEVVDSGAGDEVAGEEADSDIDDQMKSNFASPVAMPTGDNIAVISTPAYIDAPTVANPTSIPAGPPPVDTTPATPTVIYTPQPTGDTGTTTTTQPETPTVNPYTGTQATSAPTYENILGTQASQFTDRANQQQTFYQPQTLQEKQDAGIDVGKIEQKLYRNNMGLTTYILHVDGVPQTPIPQGYQEVVTQASGGYIRGFQQGGTQVSEEEYQQAIKNKQAQAVISPATSVSAAPVANINPDTAGTIMPSTTGQASGVAPIVTDIAQVGTTTQATMPQNMTPQFNPDGTPMLDAEGNPVYKDTGFKPATATGTQTDIKGMTFDPATSEYTSQPVLDENNNPIMDPVLDAQGQPVMEQATNPDGTPKVDADGNPVMQPKTKMRMQTALSDAATITGQQATETMVSGVDAAQNLEPVLDKDGNPVMEQVFDAQGNPVLDPETGQPVTRAKMKTKATTVEGAPTRTLQQTREPLKDSKGNNITDADGNIMYKDSELVSGSAVDQTKVGEAFGTGEVQAASVQDELSSLMAQFEGGDTPAWAAGSMRKANQMLAARGLSASSMAGQAVIQAAMEAALPIAQIDAGNKQQMALMKAEQRAKFLQMEFDQDFQAKVINASKVSEIANMNFSAEQQVALENARMAQTVDLANLNNRQAVVMAEAAALSQLDLANLSNLQQAAVQNAQNFLQVDMANLSNAQQMEMFKQQTLANSILTDAAADNAMAQFNATSELQRDQFMTSQATQISQFNAAQTNAMAQFNANEANAMAKYNSEIQNQREMFNAQQYAVIAQANAKWRQDATTMNTAAANQSNFEYAKQVNGLSNKVLDQIWQRERDLMQFAVAQSESALERSTRLLLGDKSLEGVRQQADAAEGAAKTSFFARMLFGNKGLNIFGEGGLLGGG
jgi:hypothetical protein